MKVLSSVLLLIASVLGGMACLTPSLKPDPTTLVYHINGEPDTLNPILGQDAYCGMISNLLFNSLIERDNKTLEWIPKMAWRWEVSSDKLQYTFYLRKDLRWQDGTLLTSDDVVFSYDRIVDTKVDAGHLRNYYQDLKKVEKIDIHTVRFTYGKTYFQALSIVGTIPIIPKHLYGPELPLLKKIWQNTWVMPLLPEKIPYNFNMLAINRAPVGDGPYVFSEWKSGQFILLKQNPNYWDTAHKPEIKQILFKVVANDTVSLQMLKKGDLDRAGLRPIQWVKQTDSEKFNQNFNKYRYPQAGYRYIGWNAAKPLFADKRVRRAMSHLLDVKALVNKLEFGLGEQTSGPFWSKSYGYDHRLKLIDYNPAAAKALLQAAGWEDHDGDGYLDKDGKKFEFTLLLPAGVRFYERMGAIFKTNLEKVGVAMEIERMEWTVFLQRLTKHDYDAISLAWTGDIDPDPYQIWHSSQRKEGSNFVNFNNAEADELMQQVRATYDQDSRAELLIRLHQIFYDEQPYTFLYNSDALVALAKRFTNVQVYRGGLDMLEWQINLSARPSP